MNTNAVTRVVIESLPQAGTAGWVDVLSALLTPLIALIAVYVAYQQYKISRNKLTLDKFDKRYAAYEKLQEYFTVLIREGRVTDDAVATLSQARYKSMFLFDDTIDEHIDALWTKAFEMRRLRGQLFGPQSLPVGNERNAACDAETELLKWNVAQQESSPKRFRKFLSLA